MVKAQSASHLPQALPSYTIRESQRAKHLRLQISVDKGLEVVIPRGFDKQQIPEILHKKRAWLERASQQIEEQRQWMKQDPPDRLPESIYLQTIAEEWGIEYQFTKATRIVLTECSNHQLLLKGAIDNIELCQKALRRWLTQKGYQHLVPWLQTVSQNCELPFRRAFVKGQKTLWGSCSSQKNINLNYKLLFLPPAMVRYVFIHELCHTLELNHSPKFWSLVRQWEPNYKGLDAELKDAWRLVPGWVEKTKRSR